MGGKHPYLTVILLLLLCTKIAAAGDSPKVLFNVSTGPAFHDFYPNGAAWAVAADFAFMNHDELRGFTFGPLLYRFFSGDNTGGSVRNEWLIAGNVGYLMRDKTENRLRTFVHPQAAIGSLTRKSGGYSERLLMLSAALGCEYRWKDAADMVFKARPVVNIVEADMRMGVDFMAGLAWRF